MIKGLNTYVKITVYEMPSFSFPYLKQKCSIVLSGKVRLCVNV